jgi:hypothetical protein
MLKSGGKEYYIWFWKDTLRGIPHASKRFGNETLKNDICAIER